MSNYSSWRSTLSAEKVFSDQAYFAYPQSLSDGVVYLTRQDSGRTVLIHQASDGNQHCLTPAPFSLRTLANEYGGKPFWFFGSQLIFVNDEDQCLYRQRFDFTDLENATPQRISPLASGSSLMYAEVVQLSERYLLANIEQEHFPENRSYIAVVDTHNPDSPPQELSNGADFYCNLVVCPSLKFVAWVEWNHPNMPWDANCLMVSDLNRNADGVFTIGQTRRVALAKTASVCQLAFDSASRLYFSTDFASVSNNVELEAGLNYWNVWRFDPYSASQTALTQITKKELEFGYPHWQFGDHRIIRSNDDEMVCIASSPLSDHLYKIDCHTLELVRIELGDWTFQNLSRGSDGDVLAIAQNHLQSAAVVKINVKAQTVRVIKENSRLLDESGISHAEHFEFATADKKSAYGFYYPPVNQAHSTKLDSAPPLLVMVHGGPTARAYGYFDVQKQFWTQHGFGVFDVNHRGSSGYGRSYRDALYGEWGELDCTDIADGIRALVKLGKADSQKIIIRGKSAGGYAVLRALTQYPDLFTAGASYYGIGNLATLAQSTHKFESHYTDRLLGEPYSAEKASLETSLYQLRSPINSLHLLKAAMIVFQGGLDKVVPPALAHEVVDTAAKLGVKYEYVEYPEEGHGFRSKVNNIDAWQRELSFYRTVLDETD